MSQSSPSYQDQYRPLLRHLATLAPPLFIMGGFAEDARLHHRFTRQHADLDVLVLRTQLGRQLQQLTSLGLAGSEVAPGETPGCPLVFGTNVDHLHIELWVCAPEQGGGYSLDLEGQPPYGRFRVFLPKDTFQYPATTLEGVALHTISPLALYQLRAISAMTRSVGEKQANDLAVQEQLRQAFLAGQDEQHLRPRLESL